MALIKRTRTTYVTHSVNDLDAVASWLVCSPPGGGTPETFGRGVRPASQNPYPIYDQNLRFSLPYLWPDQNFDTLFMTWLLDH